MLFISLGQWTRLWGSDVKSSSSSSKLPFQLTCHAKQRKGIMCRFPSQAQYYIIFHPVILPELLVNYTLEPWVIFFNILLETSSQATAIMLPHAIPNGLDSKTVPLQPRALAGFGASDSSQVQVPLVHGVWKPVEDSGDGPAVPHFQDMQNYFTSIHPRPWEAIGRAHVVLTDYANKRCLSRAQT